MDCFSLIIDDKNYFEKLKKKDICLYGAGTKGRQTLYLLKKKGIEPIAFIDQSAGKYADGYAGVEVISPEKAVQKYSHCMVLITTVWPLAIEIEKFVKRHWKEYVVCANPFKVETRFLTKAELCKGAELIINSYELLADEKSKQLFIEDINWKITGDSTRPAKQTEPVSVLEWFMFDKLDWSRKYTYVDVGAYTGDTVIRFMMASGSVYNKIVAIEPDEINRTHMRSIMSDLRLNDKYVYISEGVWKEKNELIFYSSGRDTYESSNFTESVDKILPEHRVRKDDIGIEMRLPVNSLDNMLREMEHEELMIKIDAQGSEFEALLGASHLIAEHKPILILEFATNSQHIGDMIPFIHHLNKDYRFYLRQIILSGNSRTVLYAI